MFCPEATTHGRCIGWIMAPEMLITLKLLPLTFYKAGTHPYAP
jgi:hypothetical protein